MAMLAAVNAAAEPKRPDVQEALDPVKEAKINEIAGLPAQEVFQRLNTTEYQSDPALMYKAIYRSFHGRKTEALAFARNCLGSPLVESVDGRVVTRGREFNVARRIFETFPEEAVRPASGPL